VGVLAVEIIVAVGVLIGVAFVASRPDIGGLDDVDTDHEDIGLPTDRLLRSTDVGRLRFRAVSGWRGTAAMAKVEETLRAAEARDGDGRPVGYDRPAGFNRPAE
jgi:hypothetical protein